MLSKVSLALHAKLAAGGSCFVYRCDAFPELTFVKSRARRNAPIVIEWKVDDQAFEVRGFESIAARLNAGRCRVCRAPHGDLHLNNCPGPEVDDEEAGREAYVQSALMEFDNGEI